MQPKNVMFPTDALLLNRAREILVRLAQRHSVKLRQSYARVGKFALIQHQRYAHAKQFKRANRALKKLRTYLGRVVRDIARFEGDGWLEEIVFGAMLSRARRVRDQAQRQCGPKVYSLHAPEVESIGKGKAHRPYELMAWTTPALSGNLEALEHQEHKPCTLRQSVSILGRTSFMSLVSMLPVQSRYAKSDPEINSNNRWQIYRHA